uniref:Uncharacterized protein n=1 Tax=Physcomitrium patens TaxID=3218 RepID=A0A2K1KUD3_PHYPA|nr:hypothetical protein PHYPA_004354 [Physcomitrium patens]
MQVCLFDNKIKQIINSVLNRLSLNKRVDVPKFFNRVTTLLQAKDAQWKSMKTVGALRSKKTLPVPVNHDSLYKEAVMMMQNIKRKPRCFNTLKAPKSL